MSPQRTRGQLFYETVIEFTGSGGISQGTLDFGFHWIIGLVFLDGHWTLVHKGTVWVLWIFWIFRISAYKDQVFGFSDFWILVPHRAGWFFYWIWIFALLFCYTKIICYYVFFNFLVAEFAAFGSKLIAL